MKMSSFRMKEGLGEKSYAQNSSFQREAAGLVRHLVVESAVEAYDCFVASAAAEEQLAIADLGCATGSNSLSFMAIIVEAIAARSCKLQAAARGSSSPSPLIKPPEITVFFNDLPSNDFNTLFAAFPEFLEKMRRSSCFISTPESGGHHPATTAPPLKPHVFMAAAPGSFYGRLFPKASLLFINSSFGAVHWLSKVPAGLEDENGKPMNIGAYMATDQSPPSVVAAYTNQFRTDFRLFLESRSQELVPCSGRMALVFTARKDRRLGNRNNRIIRALAIMASKKEIEEEKADSFNMPLFFPCMEEVEEIVEEEGSFEVVKMELHDAPFPIGDEEDVSTFIMKLTRSTFEPLLANHLGSTEYVDRVFELYTQLALVGDTGDDDKERLGIMLLVLRKLP